MIYAWSGALAISAIAMRWAPGVIKYAAFAVLAVLTGFMAYWLGLFEAAHHHVDEAGDASDTGRYGTLEGSPEDPDSSG
jgi:hypothetical protein